MHYKSLKEGILFLLIGLSLGVGLFLYLGGKNNSNIDETIEIVDRNPIDFITAKGRVEAVESAVIRAGTDARIQKLLVDNGDFVQSGDELVLFDLTNNKISLEKASLKLDEINLAYQKSEIELNNLKQKIKDYAHIDETYRIKDNNYQKTLKFMDSTQRTYLQALALYDLTIESLINILDIKIQYRKAQIFLRQAREELDESKKILAQIKEARELLSSYELDYEILVKRKFYAKKELEESLLKLENLKITSPISGIVILNQINNGMFVSLGQEMMTISDTRKLQVRANVNERKASYLTIGQDAFCKFDTHPFKEYYGKIVKIAPHAAISDTGTFIETLILLNDNNDPLKIANQVNVYIIIEDKIGFINTNLEE